MMIKNTHGGRRDNHKRRPDDKRGGVRVPGPGKTLGRPRKDKNMSNTDKPFDMVEHFNSLASQEDNTAKGELFRLLYQIDGICRKNWKTMDDEVQNAIMDAVEAALAVTRSLPSAQ